MWVVLLKAECHQPAKNVADPTPHKVQFLAHRDLGLIEKKSNKKNLSSFFAYFFVVVEFEY